MTVQDESLGGGAGLSKKVLTAMKVGPSSTELREMDLPEIPSDAALLKVAVAGVCGTDVSQYRLPLRGAPLIMGHENVGYLAKVGRVFAAHKGVKEGDLMFLEHYVPCGHCEWDHMGEYRHCAATEWFYDPKAIRYGYTSIETPPSLWGGFSQYLYLPLNAVLHQVPKGLSPEQAGLATPMSNGIQWTLLDAGVGYGSSVLVQGPGQQGLCCVMAAKHAGADRIIVTGTSRDARRLEVAKLLGADDVIDVQTEDPLARIQAITGGRGVDVVVDCTAGARDRAGVPRYRGNQAPRRDHGRAGRRQPGVSPFPIGRMTRKGMTLKSARGHSYRAVEMGLHQLATHRFPIDLITTHRFELAEVDYAIKSVGGQGAEDAIHVSVMPWG